MTITLTREEAQQVLDALEKIIQGCNDVERDEHIHKDGKDVARLVRIDCRESAETLRARLAQYSELDDAIAAGDGTLHGAIDYWQQKAQREWQGLTDEEKHYLNEVLNLQGRFPIIDAIEAKLKEKNS